MITMVCEHALLITVSAFEEIPKQYKQLAHGFDADVLIEVPYQYVTRVLERHQVEQIAELEAIDARMLANAI